MQDKRLLRINATQLGLRSPKSFPVRIFANPEVAIYCYFDGSVSTTWSSVDTVELPFWSMERSAMPLLAFAPVMMSRATA